MTVIRHNSISGIVSITAAAGSNLSFYDSTGSNLRLDTGDINAGVITATTANFTNATVTGDLTVQGTTTTLDTTVTAVDSLAIDGDATAGGSVGIGTDNPAKKLEVVGDIRLPSNYTISWGDDTTRIFRSTDDIRIDTGNYERLRITSSGNIGIGTDNPLTKLHTDGTVFAGSSGFSGSSYGGIRIAPNNGSGQAGGAIYGGVHNDNNTAIFLRRGYDSTLNTIDLNSFGGIRFFTNGALASQTEKVSITSSGNVSIGTDFTPQKTLHLRDSNASGVQGTTQLRIEKGVGGGAAPGSISRNNCYIHLGGSEWIEGGGGNYLIGFGYSNGEVGTGFPAYVGYVETSSAGYTNGDLIFGTRTSTTGTDNPIERMRIHDNGYVEGHRHPIESGSTLRQQDGSGSGAATGWVAVNSTTWDWDPNESHYISCTFEGYIQSGTYWWTWRLYNSTRSEYLIPFLGANRLDNTSGYGSIAYIGSVHSYSRQPYVAFKKSASTQIGDTIQLQLHASNASGSTLYTNASQTLYARYITFHAGVATGGSTL